MYAAKDTKTPGLQSPGSMLPSGGWHGCPGPMHMGSLARVKGGATPWRKRCRVKMWRTASSCQSSAAVAPSWTAARRPTLLYSVPLCVNSFPRREAFFAFFPSFFSTPSAPPCRQATWHCPRSRRSAAGAHRAAAADTGGHPRAQARALGKANPTISGIVRFNKASLPSSFHAPG